MQDRRPFDNDIGFLGKLARQGLYERLADLDPTARQMPASNITMLDQQHPAAFVEDEAANPEGHRPPQQKPRMREAQNQPRRQAAGRRPALLLHR